MTADAVLPMTDKPAGIGASLHTALYIATWIFFSNLTILFNKWLIDTVGFRYPVTLTCWHLVFATLATQFLARSTTLLDGRHHVEVTRRTYLRTVVPIGLLYSGSLACSNLVYLYLSVAFIQMLKAAAPVAVLVASWAWGVASPSAKTMGSVLVIVLGVALASAGEIEFSWPGFLFQLGGIVFGAVRLVMIQVMLSEDGQKMDPLVGLYYYAPVCAVMSFLVAWASEFGSFRWEDLARAGPGVLVLNALVAFLLNVSSVLLIGKTSGLVMTLTGILKNILLVVVSVLIWHTTITFLQFIGYAIAVGGLVCYSLGWERIKTQSAVVTTWASTQWNAVASSDNSLTPLARRCLPVGLLVLFTLTVIWGALTQRPGGAHRLGSGHLSYLGIGNVEPVKPGT